MRSLFIIILFFSEGYLLGLSLHSGPKYMRRLSSPLPFAPSKAYISTNTISTALYAKSKKALLKEQEEGVDEMDENKSAKREALSGVLSQIERVYGRGSIQKLGESPSMKVETFSSGSLTLDLALGDKFFPLFSIIAPFFFLLLFSYFFFFLFLVFFFFFFLLLLLPLFYLVSLLLPPLLLFLFLLLLLPLFILVSLLLLLLNYSHLFILYALRWRISSWQSSGDLRSRE